MTRRSTPLIVLCAAFLSACPGDKKCQPRVVETEEECTTTEDCVNAGYFGLGCVSGICGRTCTRDDDCTVVAKVTSEDEELCPELADIRPVFVCEQQLCKAGCPDVACGSGETCVGGRCAIFSEGWEPANGIDTVTPEIKGWNNDDRELSNVKTKVVYEGETGCARGDEKCAGPASDGRRFVAIERVPTPPQSTPTLTDTCRACTCCLECKLAPPAATLTLLDCPRNIDIPAEAMCPAQTPAVCANVCTACDACTNAPPTREIGAELKTCEAAAAAKTCPACEMECQTGQPCPPPACTQCRDAELCDLQTPGTARCNMLHAACDAQGADGCFSTPIARPRSQLTDKEQSLLSPAISLAGISGDLVLELEYVPFDVGEQYRVVEQGVDPMLWDVKTQEVVLELCGGNCNSDSAWMPGATFPRDTERRNGVRLGAQSIIDWRSNRAVVAIPEALRTGEFRFRLVPRLADNVRFGVDKIIVRRRSP